MKTSRKQESGGQGADSFAPQCLSLADSVTLRTQLLSHGHVQVLRFSLYRHRGFHDCALPF